MLIVLEDSLKNGDSSFIGDSRDGGLVSGSFSYMRRGYSIITSIIIFNMVITTAGIMARYNSHNMIAGNSLKSLRWEKYVDCP